MNQRILITGASGTIGSEVSRALQAQGLKFTVMTSKNTSHVGVLPTVLGSFANPDTLYHAFKDFDTVFLLVPLVPEMVEYGINAIDAAKRAGVRHIVRSSGAGADPNSQFVVARVHGAIDQHLKQSGLDWTILCPNSFMQNFLSYYREPILRNTYYMPHGVGAISLVDVRDIGECVAAVLANPQRHIGRTYTLTGGEALTNTEQMAIISAALGRSVRYIDIPEQAAIEAMTRDGFPQKVIEILMSLNAVIKSGYAAGISGDVEFLTRHMPRPFSKFVQESVRAWQ